MCIFDEDEIEENELYAPVMVEINDLYQEKGEPSHILDGESSSTTTGNSFDPYWQPGSIGDWDCKEKIVADWAQEQLNDVFNGLKLSGNGGISSYQTTRYWREFEGEAISLIDDFHNDYAFDRLCNKIKVPGVDK